MKRIILSCLVLGAWMCSTALATETTPLQRSSEIRYGVLDNGLTYYIWPNQNPKGEALYRLWIRSGSLNEKNNQLGLAHFLEHMAFNGTEHFPGDQMVRFLESKGAKFAKDINAHTTFDETVYKLQMPSYNPAVVDSTLLILSDWAYGLTLDPVEVEKEKDVILSEWLARHSQGTNTNDTLLQILFQDTRYAERLTIGDTSIVRHATPELLRSYYQDWYRPELAAIAVVGDVQPEQVEQTLHRLFDGWNASDKAPKAVTYSIPPYKRQAVSLATSSEEKKIELEIIGRIPSSGPVRDEEQMQQYVLNKMTQALLKQRLARCTFWDYSYSSASMTRSSVVRGGDLLLSSATLNAKDITAGIQKFWMRREQIQRYGFCRAEIDHVAKTILNKARQAADETTQRTSSIMMEELYNDYMRQMCCMDPKQELALLERFVPQVDSVAVLQYLQTMIHPEQEQWFLHGDTALLRQIPDAKTLRKLQKKMTGSHGKHTADIGRYCIEPHQIAELLSPADTTSSHLLSTDTIPAIGCMHWRFDNGSDVYYRQRTDNQDRLLLTGFRAGGLYHLESTLYQSGLMANAIIPMCGAGTMDEEALKEYLENSTASMNMLIDKSRTGVAGKARRQDIRQLFQLLYTKWVGPRVDTVLYNRVIKELEDADSIRQQAPPQLLLKAFERLYGSAQGYHFILVGDIPADTILNLCDRWIGALPSGPKSYQLVHRVLQPLRQDTIETEYTGKEKATVAMSWERAIDQQDTLFSLYKFQLLEDLLKGVVSTHLRQVLREEMGITYSVSVVANSALHIVPMWRNGIVCSCLPEKTDTVQSVVRRELQQMAEHPEVFASTMDDVKQNLRIQHYLHLQQDTWWTGYIRNLIYNNEKEWDMADRYAELLKEVTPEQVAAQIRLMLTSPCKVKVSSREFK